MYNKMKLYSEIKAEMENVIQAEENAKAWKQEASSRMKPVNLLIRTAQHINGLAIDKKELLAEIRAELMPETEVTEPDEQDTNNAIDIEAETID